MGTMTSSEPFRDSSIRRVTATIAMWDTVEVTTTIVPRFVTPATKVHPVLLTRKTGTSVTNVTDGFRVPVALTTTLTTPTETGTNTPEFNQLVRNFIDVRNATGTTARRKDTYAESITAVSARIRLLAITSATYHP